MDTTSEYFSPYLKKLKPQLVSTLAREPFCVVQASGQPRTNFSVRMTLQEASVIMCQHAPLRPFFAFHVLAMVVLLTLAKPQSSSVVHMSLQAVSPVHGLKDAKKTSKG